MKVWPGRLRGIVHIEPQRFGDSRGWFMESWQGERYADAGLTETFVQDNVAMSGRGVLRGLHLQQPHGQGKLVQVLQGQVFDVAVDVRRGSPTFGQWEAVLLDGDAPRQFYVPAGFAHGYQVLSEQALFSYKCTDHYHPESEISVRWDDPQIGIDWPLETPPSLSEKDAQGLPLAQVPQERLPRFAP